MKIFKAFIVAALLFFLILHTSFTLLYTLPGNLVPSTIKTASIRYMHPVFDQGWALFAPVPEVNKKVYVNCLTNGTWSGWQAPFDTYLNSHQSARINASAKIVLAVSGTLHYLYNENADALNRNKSIVGNSNSEYFRVLKYSVEKELMRNNNPAKKIKILVVYTKAHCVNGQFYSIYYPEFGLTK